MVEVMRLKERIGGYHKYFDNACVNQPDPTSSHFLNDAERFDKDFASYDKKIREAAHKQKMEMIEKKRVEKFERDMSRWSYMDNQEQMDKNRLQYMKDHYNTGKKNSGGAAYNVINLGYDNSPEGQRLAQMDEDAKVRAMMRSKNIDVRSNCGYNVITGSDRSQVEIPANERYNPLMSQTNQEAGHRVVHGSQSQPQLPPYQQQN